MGNLVKKGNRHDQDILKVVDEQQKTTIIKSIDTVILPHEIDIDEAAQTIYKRWSYHTVKEDPRSEVIVRIRIVETPNGHTIYREVALDRWENRKTATYY